MRGSPDRHGVNRQAHELVSLPCRGYRLQLLGGQAVSMSEVGLMGTMESQWTCSPAREGQSSSNPACYHHPEARANDASSAFSRDEGNPSHDVKSPNL